MLAVQANSTNSRAVTNTTEQGKGCTRIQTAVYAANGAEESTTFVALLNPSDVARDVSVTFAQLGIDVSAQGLQCVGHPALAMRPPLPVQCRQRRASRAICGPMLKRARPKES